MSLFEETDIDYPFTVTVKRPKATFTETGSYTESFDTIVEGMTVDIQLSLKVRKVVSEDKTGMTENMVWIMFCDPPAAIMSGDLVTDGSRTFSVEAVGDWGSHTECVMRKV